MNYTLHQDCKACPKTLSTYVEKMSGYCTECRNSILDEADALPEG